MFKAFLNEEGKKTWGFVFPEGSVPIESPIPIQAELPDGQQLIYIVAWDELKPLERGLILNFLAERFKAPVSEVEKQIVEKGMPLRASLVDATSIPARYF